MDLKLKFNFDTLLLSFKWKCFPDKLDENKLKLFTSKADQLSREIDVARELIGRDEDELEHQVDTDEEETEGKPFSWIVYSLKDLPISVML